MMLVLMMLSMGNVFGKSIKQSETYKTPITLQDYIQSYCKAGCVDQEDLLKSVSDTARELDIDFKDLLAIAKVESKFKVKATSRGNKGLLQVNVSWHKKKLKGRNPYNVKVNVEVGGGIYKDCLIKHKGNRSKSLRCYNGNGDKKYVKKVDQARDEIDKLIDLERKEGDEEQLIAMFVSSEKENLMSSTAKTSFDRVVTNAMLKEKLDSYGNKAKGLVTKPRGGVATSRGETWDIFILMKDDSTVWLTTNHYGKHEAEVHIQKILTA